MSSAVNGESAAGEKSPHSVGDDPKREGNQDVDINIYEINEMLSESINEEQHNENPTQSHVTYEDKQKRPITPEHGDDVESESKRQRTDNSSDANTKVDSTKNTIANDGELEYIEQRSTNAEKNESKVTSNDEMPDEQPSQTEESPRTVYHDGIAVPANSELLNTNTAFAAYNALSSHFPPLSSISNAHLSDLPLPIIAPDYIPPRIQLLINTLPTLDNLCTQILRIVAITPYQKVVDLASNPESPSGATYRDLISLFEFTKKLYSEEDPFLTVEHIAPGMWKEGEKTPSMLRNREQSIESTLRKVNLATFLVAALGTIEVGFFHLNESFLDVFCPANSLEPENTITNMNPDDTSLQGGLTSAIGDKVGKLLKPQAELFLELKTQAFISALEAGDRTRKEIIEDIIPENLGQLLSARRDTTILSPTEQDFLDRCAARRDILLNYPEDRNIADEYDWFAFLKELFDYISKNVGSIIWGKKTKGIKKSIPSVSKDVSNEEELIRSASTIPASEQSSGQMSPKGDLGSSEISELASSLLPSEIQEQQLHLRINPSSNVRNLQRRPWTRDEEKALRHALELKGPSWSTILELFGNGGKISEALKNRTQVQLKDKARNWKMFFLKSGLPVPNYLQKVTGDLERDDRSRANKRANKNKKNILMNHSPAESQSPGLEDVKR